MLLVQQIISGIALGGLYALVALSFTFVIGVVNFLNFSIPGVFMLSGMTTWAMLHVYHAPLALSIVAAITIAIVASLLVERFTYRYMRAKFGDASEHATPLVSSIGFLILFQGLMTIAFGGDVKPVDTPWPIPICARPASWFRFRISSASPSHSRR